MNPPIISTHAEEFHLDYDEMILLVDFNFRAGIFAVKNLVADFTSIGQNFPSVRHLPFLPHTFPSCGFLWRVG